MWRTNKTRRFCRHLNGKDILQVPLECYMTTQLRMVKFLQFGTKDVSLNTPRLQTLQPEPSSLQYEYAEPASSNSRKSTNLSKKILFSNRCTARKGEKPVSLTTYHMSSQHWLLLPGIFSLSWGHYVETELPSNSEESAAPRGSNKNSYMPCPITLTYSVDIFSFQMVIKPVEKYLLPLWKREPGFASSPTL